MTKEIKQHQRFDHSNDYKELKFSKPVYLSDEKVCLFVSINLLNRKHKGTSGADMIIFFKKEADNWKLSQKKTIITY